MGAHVGFESWLERDNLMLLDFDPAVAAVSSQPFWLFWNAENGKTRSHAPDYFARLHDGSAVVVDCRPIERIKPKDAATFRGHPGGLRADRLALPAGRGHRRDPERERTLAGRLPPPAS